MYPFHWPLQRVSKISSQLEQNMSIKLGQQLIPGLLMYPENTRIN